MYQNVSFLRSIPTTHVTRNYGHRFLPTLQSNQTLPQKALCYLLNTRKNEKEW